MYSAREINRLTSRLLRQSTAMRQFAAQLKRYLRITSGRIGMECKIASHLTLESAIKLGPPPDGNLAIPVFRHGSMEAGVYTPEETDSQTPHTSTTPTKHGLHSCLSHSTALYLYR